MGIMRGTYTGYVIFFTDQPETKKVATNDGKLTEGAVVFTTFKKAKYVQECEIWFFKIVFYFIKSSFG